MKTYISKEFHFDAAHNLINYNGKCEKLHGHTYKLRVTLEGYPDKRTGMIIDFIELSRIVKEKIIDKLDHSYINELIEQTTAENISQWIWKELEFSLKSDNYHLYEITLWETETSFITLRKEVVIGARFTE